MRDPRGKSVMFLRNTSLSLLLARFLAIAPPYLREAITPSFGGSIESWLKIIWIQNDLSLNLIPFFLTARYSQDFRNRIDDE